MNLAGGMLDAQQLASKYVGQLLTSAVIQI